ncbi:MAG: PIN domain-containing protein [Gammaproteobacteria bacterium]|nr:PIN domain-containing protein [Gammaproteobacteria bacterium]NNJ84435.1 PIN domain-containing protein [Gammaproteobacteria bacterium]
MSDRYVAEQPGLYHLAPKGLYVPEGHEVILIDSCIWIYYFEDHPRYADLIDAMLTQWVGRGTALLTSELSLLEIKTGPLRREKPSVAAEYQLYLNNFPGLSLIPIDQSILNHAARLRARCRIKTPDAIIIATGLEQGATLAITNDQAWKGIDGMGVVCLEDLAVP